MILVRERKILRYVRRVLDTKEWRESEERATEEENEDKDDDTEDEGGRLAGAPLEYYDDFADSDSVEAAATTVL